MAAPEPDPAPAPPEDRETPGAPTPPAHRSSPALRASDADRERTATVLRDAGGDGRLTVDELDGRLDAAYAAVTRDDLDALVADLVPAGTHSVAAGADPAPGRVAVRGGDGGSRWLVAIMSGVERAGVWRLGRRCTSLSLMGGSELDLTHVEFDDQDVHLRVVCVMGGAEIRVPEHMNVVVSDFGFMGGNDVRVGHAQPDPGGPTLHLHLVSVMGGSNVERGPKRSRRERRELERRDRERLGRGG
ncbi:DUF1707 SHOCT-like domain-containing protein [Patulibacter minatonensis]|uniref:DUF1707 SHOCT-like domain-containing protein n=1 Tax=Patulibacter minatonensis TaxID=298163 RepID=UPI0004BC8402|nr:DUF1707 domain-containing protein [Patulibacter minatonensis]